MFGEEGEEEKSLYSANIFCKPKSVVSNKVCLFFKKWIWEDLKSYASNHDKFSILKGAFCNKVLLRLDHNLVEMLMPKNEESDSCLIHLWAGRGRKKMAFFGVGAGTGQNISKDGLLNKVIMELSCCE